MPIKPSFLCSRCIYTIYCCFWSMFHPKKFFHISQVVKITHKGGVPPPPDPLFGSASADELLSYCTGSADCLIEFKINFESINTAFSCKKFYLNFNYLFLFL